MGVPISTKKLNLEIARKGCTQKELSEASGVCLATIWHLLHRNDAPAKHTTAHRLASALGVDVSAIIGV